MIYVALLRGINVGGNAKVEMPRLKKTFESIGCKSVATYINSGNVIFTDDRSPGILKPRIEEVIEREFGFKVPVVLRDSENITMLCREIPENWANDDKLKTDVMFLWDEADNPSILEKVKYNPEIENVKYLDGALIWSIGRENVTRGGGIKLIKTDLYRLMTVRNVNTLRKLKTIIDRFD